MKKNKKSVRLSKNSFLTVNDQNKVRLLLIIEFVTNEWNVHIDTEIQHMTSSRAKYNTSDWD